MTYQKPLRKLSLKELNRISVDAFQKKAKPPIVVVLDNIRSGLNVGSIFRSGDAFAIDRLILCGISAQPPHREVLKSAIGATGSVAWKYHPSIKESILDLKDAGYQIWGIEQTTGSKPLHDLSWMGEKIALVFGNEVNGLSEEVLPLLDLAIEVPQFGTKHSLNVAVCAGIVLWHLAAKG